MRILNRLGAHSWIGIAAFLLVASEATAAPRIEVDCEEWSFREALSGTAVQHVFEIKNTGDEPLQLGQIRGLCTPCTGSVVSANPIAPSASGKLLLTYRTEEKLGDVKAGVVVHTNDPEQPFKKLILKGKVLARGDVPKISSLPERIETGVIVAGAPAEYALRISNGGKEPLFIEDVTSSGHCTSDWIPKQEKKQLLPGQHMKLTVLVDTKHIRGTLTEYVVIRSNDPAQHLLTVPITGYVADSASDVGVIPDTVMVGIKDDRLEITGHIESGAKVLISSTPPKPTAQWLAEKTPPDAEKKLSAPVRSDMGEYTYILIAVPVKKEVSLQQVED